MTKLIKGVKLRLYPNKQQQAQLWQMFGNDRRVWNLGYVRIIGVNSK